MTTVTRSLQHTRGATALADPYPSFVPTERKPPVRPLDPPMVPFALAGTAGWIAAGLVLLVIGAPAEWLRTCLAGVLLGLALLVLMIIRDRRRPRDRSAG